MPLRSYKPTSPGRRFMTRSTFEEITTDQAAQAAARAARSAISGRNSQGRLTVRHRGGGEKRHYRRIDFKRDKYGRAGAAGDDRVRPQPLGAHRPAALPRRREALHARAQRPERRRHRRRRPGRRGARRQCPAAAQHPARHDHPQHRAGARQGRPDRPLAPAAPRSCWPRKATTPRSACRRARSAASTCAAWRPSARSATSTTRTRASARPAARGTWASGPRCAAWSMNPRDHPHGGGEGKSPTGMPPKTPWGQPAMGHRTRRNKTHRAEHRPLPAPQELGRSEVQTCHVRSKRDRSSSRGSSAASRR